MFFMLQPFFADNDVKMGRDQLFSVLSENKMLIRTRIRKVSTTYSQHWLRKWPNLIKGKVIERPNELWVSDITYWRIKEKFVYISLITDAYSRKIVGHYLSEALDTASSCKALIMALNAQKIEKDLIHHSDRGVQYCSNDYVKILQENNIQISMTESGDPRDNAIAERINGILKNEYLYKYKPGSLSQAQYVLQKAIYLYNHQRPHLSINLHTPEFAHKNSILAKRKWRTYFKKHPVNVFQD